MSFEEKAVNVTGVAYKIRKKIYNADLYPAFAEKIEIKN